MYAVNQDKHGTAYTVTVDAKHGVGTGISASDRATTMKLLADPGSVANDFKSILARIARASHPTLSAENAQPHDTEVRYVRGLWEDL